jgi:hypothetical protein
MWAKRSSPKTLLWFLDAFVYVLPQSCSDTTCDRNTSEMRGLCPKIISGDFRRSENAQTHTYKHTVPYMKFKLKLSQIKCHVLEFTKDEAQKMLQRIIRVFAEAFVSHDRHTPSSDNLHLWVPVGNLALIGLDLPLPALVGVTERRRKILSSTQINKNNKSKRLTDYAQQDLSVMTRRPRNLDLQGLKWINGLKPTSTYY